MDTVRKYPLCFASGTYIAVLLLTYRLEGMVRLCLLCASFAMLAIGIILAAAMRRNRYVSAGLLITAAVFVSLCVSHVYFGVYEGAYEEYFDGEEHLITGTVTSVSYTHSYESAYEVKTDSIDGKKAYAKLQAVTLYGSDCVIGDAISFRAVCSEFPPETLGFPTERYYTSKGILFKAEIEEGGLTLTGEKGGIAVFFNALNSRLKQILIRYIGDQSGAVSALLLGNRDDASDTLKRDFSTLGISHLLALSGMHLTILLGGVEWILRKLHIGKPFRLVVLSLAGILFALTAGSPLSLVRSLVMLLVFYASFFFRRESEPITSLFFAVGLICFISPASVLDCGLQLSFAATFGIVFASVPLGGFLRAKAESLKGRRFCQVFIKALIPLCTSVCAVIFTLPLNWLYFGSVSVASPLTTLIFAVPISVILYTSPLVIAFSPFPFLARPAALICALSVRFCEWLAGKLAALPGLKVSLRYPFVPYLFIISALSLVLITVVIHFHGKRHADTGVSGTSGVSDGLTCSRPMSKKRLLMFLMPAAVFAVGFAFCVTVYSAASPQKARILVYASGKNDGIVVQSGSSVLVCDISDGSYTPAKLGAQLCSEYLFSDRLDCYMLTHYHKRHISSVVRLMRNFRVKLLLMPEPCSEDDEAVYEAISAAAQKEGSEVLLYPSDADALLSFADTLITVMSRTYISRSTHPLIALRISTGEESVTYLNGALFETVETGFLRTGGYFVFGSHLPKIKKPLPIDISELLPCAVAVIGQENAGMLGIDPDLILSPDKTLSGSCFEIKLYT